jgi:hypothetical protein
VHIHDSTFTGNSAHYRGGTISDEDERGARSHVTLNRVVISGSSAPAGRGGAIFNGGDHSYHVGVTLTLINTTITGSSAAIGGGILNFQTGVVTINASTIANNTGGGGVVEEDGGGGWRPGEKGTLTLNSVILGGNAGGDCRGVMTTSGGHNLIQHDAECTLKSSTGGTMPQTLTGLDPHLGPLSNNGGYLKSMALRGSRAVGYGNPSICSGVAGGVDTRKWSRNVAERGNKCDAGAFDTQG